MNFTSGPKRVPKEKNAKWAKCVDWMAAVTKSSHDAWTLGARCLSDCRSIDVRFALIGMPAANKQSSGFRGMTPTWPKLSHQAQETFKILAPPADEHGTHRAVMHYKPMARQAPSHGQAAMTCPRPGANYEAKVRRRALQTFPGLGALISLNGEKGKCNAETSNLVWADQRAGLQPATPAANSSIGL